ncbi:MAG: hypothetical protein K2X87_26075 [Gemmataceae bacterium]|nr:hypothetical protein [Gemmataceae bacterium]
MTDFSIRDLASAVGFAAAAYALFNVLVSFGSGKPVAEWINPHRRYLLSLAAVLLLGAGGLLDRAAEKYQTPAADLLRAMVQKEVAKPEVVGAVSFLLLAGTAVALDFWCRWILPRAPSTFSPGAADIAAECRRAMRHYARWSGQLDYAALFHAPAGGPPEKLVGHALPAKTVFARMRRIDSMQAAAADPPDKAAEGQLTRWDELAGRCFAGWDDLDRLIAPARQGDNVLIVFDMQYGGVFVELIQEFAGADGRKVRVFLFAVCLDQHGLNTAEAARYYAMLSAAVRHVRTGGGKSRG